MYRLDVCGSEGGSWFLSPLFLSRLVLFLLIVVFILGGARDGVNCGRTFSQICS